MESSLYECNNVKQDIELMENVDWKNNVVALIFQCSDFMADDYSGSILFCSNILLKSQI
jgi:hypothetical protein